MNPEQIAAAASPAASALLAPAQQAVVAFARELTATAAVRLETVAAVKRHLGERELVDLTFTVATANFSNRVIHGLGVALEAAAKPAD